MKALLVYALIMVCGSIGHRKLVNDVKTVHWEQMDEVLKSESDTVFIINFWATWCRPCIEELPDFQEIHEKYKDKKVCVILVSLDPAEQKDKVSNFIEKKGMNATVWLLDETDFNAWVDKIDPSWSGAIPATLIYQGSTSFSKFREGKYTAEELSQLINQQL